ncbi:MAG: cupin domain-containing protein [Pseudomonadota bacterium]
MTSERFSEFCSDAFFDEYWQRRPLLVRDAIDATLLQGVDLPWLLSAITDPRLHSRLVEGPDRDDGFSVRYGPDLSAPTGDLPWTLLVRDVDKVLPEADMLLDRFARVGRWRLEDVMVSYAATGGSVGPHLDHYDVFLVQGIGRRHWQIDASADPDGRLRPDQELQLLADFQPTDEWVLEPGDCLYLPPGVPHHGVALDACTTWSIGLRTPSAAELWADFAEWQIGHCEESQRLVDPYRTGQRSGEIVAEDLAQLRRTLGGVEHVTDANLACWFGEMVTRGGVDWADDGSATVPQRDEALLAGVSLTRVPGALLAWYAEGPSGWLFANGERYAVDPQNAAMLAGNRILSSAELVQLAQAGQQDLLSALCREGVFRQA